jgi:hypothetical protein
MQLNDFQSGYLPMRYLRADMLVLPPNCTARLEHQDRQTTTFSPMQSLTRHTDRSVRMTSF